MFPATYEMSDLPEEQVRLYRNTPPDDASELIAWCHIWGPIHYDGRKAFYADQGTPQLPQQEAIEAVLVACERIWPDCWRAAYLSAFNANPERLYRHIPPIKIARVLAWANTQDKPAKNGAALLAYVRGVGAADLMAAEKAIKYAE